MWKTNFGLFMLVIGLLVGCESEPNRLPVSGSVSLDGKPMGDCVLVFRSLDSTDSPCSAIAMVSDGRFEITGAYGLNPGFYGVVFTELQPNLEDYEAARSAGSRNALKKKFIPKKYTVPNELRITIASDIKPITISLKSR